jgi:alkylation response protein AidB-like acyl-CoA dehydrogenase
VASGRRLAAFGLTEANAGSYAAGIRTEARKVGDDYILNGTKQWITNGGEADLYSVVAMTDRSRGGRGATAFIVEKGMEGFSFGKKEKKLGIRASTTRELVFQDCKVPKENVIGREGMGFILAMRTFDRTRPGIGAQGVGVAQAALDAAVGYAKEREQFERKIISFQAIQHMLADMATQVEAARALVYAVSRYIDSNPRDFSKVSAMSKVFPSDVAMKVTVDALQIFGATDTCGNTYRKDDEGCRRYCRYYEGTNQILEKRHRPRADKGSGVEKEMSMKKDWRGVSGQGSSMSGWAGSFTTASNTCASCSSTADRALDMNLSKTLLQRPDEELPRVQHAAGHPSGELRHMGRPEQGDEGDALSAGRPQPGRIYGPPGERAPLLQGRGQAYEEEGAPHGGGLPGGAGRHGRPHGARPGAGR